MAPDIAAARSLEEMMRAGAAMLSTSASPRLDARVLARHVLQCDDAALIMRSRETPEPSVRASYRDAILRRSNGEPVAYITGEKEFWGLNFRVNESTLVPRADSECLVEAVLAAVDRTGALRILDLGTGSGCLLCALLDALPNATGLGVDISAVAAATARENARRLGMGARAQFLASNWFGAITGRFDIVVANAPYIPTGDAAGLSRDVSDFEPHGALFAGADGLDAYREILAGLPAFLTDGACAAFEYGAPGQGTMLRAMIAETFNDVEVSVIRDLAARERGIFLRVAADPGKKGLKSGRNPVI